MCGIHFDIGIGRSLAATSGGAARIEDLKLAAHKKPITLVVSNHR